MWRVFAVRTNTSVLYIREGRSAVRGGVVFSFCDTGLDEPYNVIIVEESHG
jgi:hypothetical protein